MRDREAAADPPAGVSVRVSTMLWIVLAGAAVGCCGALALAPPRGARFEARLPWTGTAPAPDAWPHAARAGESMRVQGTRAGFELVVTAGSAREARELARAFAGVPAPGVPSLAERIESTRAEWRRSLPADPMPAHTSATEVAARLLARARWGRALAGLVWVAENGPSTPEPTAPAGVVGAWQHVYCAALANDPIALAMALERTAALEDKWFADANAWPGVRPAARAEAWRSWQLARSRALEDAAARALARQTPFQRRLARQLSREYLVTFDTHAGAPWRTFVAPDARSVRPWVRPIAAVWWPTLAWGAAVGVLLALLTLGFASWLHARNRLAWPQAQALYGTLTPADPAAAGPRLHVISGSTPSAVMRAALELAARRVALGERVLVVDGSARLRLHERLGRDARWGLLECLAADMPVLGLVQYAGHPGLYLLPHGDAERAVGWSSLGRKLDEVVPHFGRIVLALDPLAPAAIGDAVRGRAMEGWWAGADRHAVAAADLATARFGIVFNGLDLAEMPDASLEVLAERVSALRPPGPAPEAAPITARALPRKPPVPPMAQEPIVLDCDLQVRQRLRFLAWMRRVQAQDRHTEAQAQA